MKRVILMLGCVLIGFASCQKDEVIRNPSEKTPKREQSKAIGSTNKEPNLSGGDDDPGCISGNSNCLEFCCVTPAGIEGFMDAVDNDKLSDFLTPARIAEISGGNSYYAGILADISVGNKQAIYQYSREGKRVFFFYGANVSVSSYEATQVFDL